MSNGNFLHDGDCRRLFDVGGGVFVWGFARTRAGLLAFHEKVGRKFSGDMLKSLEGYSRWLNTWTAGQYPMFVEDNGRFVGVGNAYAVMSYLRYLSIKATCPPIEIMWNRRLGAILNIGNGGWGEWLNRHDRKVRMIPARLYGLDCLHDDASALAFETMDDWQIQVRMRSKSVRRRRMAARCVNWIMAHCDKSCVLRMLDDPDVETRRIALERLDVINLEHMHGMLARMAGDPDWTVRVAALRQILELLHYEIDENVIPDLNAGASAAIGLPNEFLGGDDFAVSDDVTLALAGLSNDPEQEVRLQCAAGMHDFLTGRDGWGYHGDDVSLRVIREAACANRHDDWFMPELMMKIMEG